MSGASPVDPAASTSPKGPAPPAGRNSERLLLALCRAVTPAMVRRSLATAALVGGTLFAVNSGGSLLLQGPTPALVAKLAFTLAVPFVVSLTSAAWVRLELRALAGPAPCAGQPVNEDPGGAPPPA